MIKAISHLNLSDSGQLYLGQFRLRYQEFIERQGYDVKTLHSMEFDEYDTLASVYLVYSENGRDVLGVSRLTPTDKGCMLADHWPELVENKSLLNAPDIWEGTRFCIDKHLPSDKRLTILRQLSLSYIEFGLANDISRIIGLMPTLILRSVFERSGVTLERLGPVQQIGQHAKIQAASIAISPQQLHQVQLKTGLKDVLETDTRQVFYLDDLARAAA